MRGTLGLLVTGLLLAVAAEQGYPRLGRAVLPVRYSLHIRPDMAKLTYTGTLRLDLQVRNETSEFCLDLDGGLELLDPGQMNLDGDPALKLGYTTDRTGDRLCIRTEAKLRPNYWPQLTVSFAGEVRSQLDGFYLSWYTFNHTKRYLASTQFETSGARKTFPCFDEPAFRSRFALEMSLDPGWRAISNTPILNDTLRDGVRRVVFEEMESTPIYLVGWVVYQEDSFGPSALSPIDVPTEGCPAPSIRYDLWSNREYSAQDGLALHTAPTVVATLEGFTGIRCKAVTKKVDLVAIPDFSAGAMENWGIITFKESALMSDSLYSTTLDSQEVLLIVSHELVHQWFGNLVTPDWWSYAWLNEGFARYLGYFIPHKILPQLELDKQFLLDRRQRALEADGPSAHPLTNEDLRTENDLSDIFDIITYEKGAAIIHMYRSVLGDTEFKEGINKYLTTVESSGGVTTPDMFFNSFPNLTKEMRRWTETSGYPVVVVEESKDSIFLSQMKIVGWNQTEPSDWLIPVTVKMNNITSKYFIEGNKTLTIVNTSQGYSINVNQTGYFRTLFRNPARWMLIQDDLSMVIDDAFALAFTGLLPYNVALEMTFSHLKAHSLDYYIWSAGLKGLLKLEAILQDTEVQSNFTKTVLNQLLEEEYNKVKEVRNSSIFSLHRMNIMQQACYYGHPDCLSSAIQLTKNISNADADTRAALLCSGVEQGNSSTWEMIWNQYLASKSPAESQLMLNALTCTKDRVLIRRFLEQLLKENIRKHDVEPLFSLVCSRKSGFEEAFTFFKTNSQNLYNYLGLKKFLDLVSSMKNKLNETHLAELKSIGSVIGVNLDAIIAGTEKAIHWRKNNYEQLLSYYNVPVVPGTTTNKPSAGNLVTANYSFLAGIFIFICVFISNSF